MVAMALRPPPNLPALFFDILTEKTRGAASAAEKGRKAIQGSALAHVVSGIAEREARTAAGYGSYGRRREKDYGGFACQRKVGVGATMTPIFPAELG